MVRAAPSTAWFLLGLGAVLSPAAAVTRQASEGAIQQLVRKQMPQTEVRVPIQSPDRADRITVLSEEGIACPPTCLYEGEAETTTTTTTTTTPKIQTKFDIIYNSVDTEDPNLQIAGGGWKLVRHTSGYLGTWGPWNDDLEGFAAVGNGFIRDDGSVLGHKAYDHWTIPFAGTEFDQFLFATVDGAVWVIADPIEVKGSRYADLKRHVVADSIMLEPHQLMMSNRRNDRYPQDPLVHFADGSLLYAEGNFAENTIALSMHNGANVYVRKLTVDSGGGG